MRIFPDLNIKALWSPQSITQLDADMDKMVTGVPTWTGVDVSETLAMNFTGFYACTKVLSETMATFPLQLKQRKREGGARDAEEHSLYYLTNKQPNEESTSADWVGAGMVHDVSWGNMYSYIDVPRQGRNAGQIQRLLTMKPDRVKPFRNTEGRLKYKYKRYNADGTYTELEYDHTQVLHIPGMSYDGLIGYSPVSCARQAIGIGMALEEFVGRFFGQGAHLKGVIMAPDIKDTDARKRFRESVQEAYAGLKNAHQFMVLPGANDFKSFTMSLDDAELLASRKFSLEEMARICRVPLHLVQNLDRATYSNIEHQSLEFIMFTMTPWVRRWEQRLDMKLLTDSEKRAGYFFKFNMRGLMRGDMKSQMEAFKMGREMGIYNPNRILERLDENPRTDPGGEEYWDEGPSGQGAKQNAQATVRAALEPVLADCMNRIERRQEDVIEEVGRRAKKGDREGMKAWLNGFYQRHKSDAESILSSYFKALNEPERAAKEAETVVESLRMGLESVDILDQSAVVTAIKGADAA